MEFLQPNKVFLDAVRANKSIKDTNTPSFIIRSTCASTTNRLLSYDGASAFIIAVYVTSRLAQLAGCG